MDSLIAGEIARMRTEALHEEARRWRREARSARVADARRRNARTAVAADPDPEPDPWRVWRVVEPDPGFYGRSG